MTNPVPLIDKPNAAPSDLDNLTARLAADGATAAPARAPAEDSRIPAKFKGKTLEEVVESYQHLEQRFGQLGNDHGQLRNRVDQLLELKRADDLRSGSAGAPTRAKVEVSPTQIIENPSDVLTAVRDSVLAEVKQDNDTRVSELEARLAAERFSVKHPDFVEVNNSADFLNWVNASPSRSRLATVARNNRDYEAADDLLSEFKQSKQHANTNEQPKPAQRSNLDRAREASLESGGAQPAASKSTERYSRAALIQLKITNPKKYAILGDKITQAYIQGRVDD